jgi:hypothetical protein
VQTTERYLGTKQDLVHAPNDAIKLRVAVSSENLGRESLPLPFFVVSDGTVGGAHHHQRILKQDSL